MTEYVYYHEEIQMLVLFLGRVRVKAQFLRYEACVDWRRKVRASGDIAPSVIKSNEKCRL